MDRLHLQAHGRVQGVAFRAHTVRVARGLGLVGWVRNRPDGTVEVLAEGPRDQLERLEAWCHAGPPAAEVERVVVEWLPSAGDLGHFSVRRD